MWQKIKNIYHACSAILACVVYGFPGNSLKIIGITGTDGKTTTTHLIHHILVANHKKASLISSVYAEISGNKFDTGLHVTSPNEWDLQKFLRQAVDAGEEYMVLEVTSHALDQSRVWGIPFKVGVVTNVTHEHLDYHKTYENYLKTKEKLLQGAEKAIINQDDKSFTHWHILKQKCITYGLLQTAEVNPKNFTFSSSLPGEYNTYNCLAAIATCKYLGIAQSQIKNSIKTFKGVKGRFDFVSNKIGLDIIIDFAHTPNAIENVLSTLMLQVKGKLIHVFGCAGLRDFTKRSQMGEKSAKFADMIILTEEDCRTEDVNQIIDEIAKGCIRIGAKEYESKDVKFASNATSPVFFRIPDRKTAIEFAIQKLAHKGDTVILTGKSHEKSLCRGTIEYAWSEYEVVNKALNGVINDFTK